MTVRAFLLLCLLPSAIYARDLQDLVSASNDFEVEMIEHEHVLERNPSASELAASTLKYARAKDPRTRGKKQSTRPFAPFRIARRDIPARGRYRLEHQDLSPHGYLLCDPTF
jgi:hypothetical protein